MFSIFTPLSKLSRNLHTIVKDCVSSFSSFWRRQRAAGSGKSVLA